MHTPCFVSGCAACPRRAQPALVLRGDEDTCNAVAVKAFRSTRKGLGLLKDADMHKMRSSVQAA